MWTEAASGHLLSAGLTMSSPEHSHVAAVWSHWGELDTSALLLLAYPQRSVFPITREP